MITDEQRETRKNCLGGSDIAKILGLSKWGTPLSVWAEKTGQIIPEDISEKLPVKLGNKMEQIVAELFEEETGKKLLTVDETIVHPEYSFLVGHIDRKVEGEDAIVEIKTTSVYMQRDWEGEQIPADAIIQTIYYMGLTGAKTGYVCCLIGNTDFQIKQIDRDEKVIADIFQRAVAFWNDFVVPVIMPAPVAGDSSILYELYPVAAEESIIDLGDEGARVVESLDSLKADRKVLDKEIEGQENFLKVMLGTYETGIAGMYKVTWKGQVSRRVDIERMKIEEPGLYEKFLKESISRVLRVSLKKSI